ncbi:type IV pilus biogenesis protein PilM (plasmid) [Pantoea allii]|uniref:type IV pilus biogenesis protein PilM n=1 Tax=Pantoea TaxID=53335 RepID=UPI000B5A99D4|nr:type IV pilus biogenesis protein PilM [Pantoea sp. AMG 501]OWY74699.1 oxidoreductase [Pantoea sp. AMG 501]
MNYSVFFSMALLTGAAILLSLGNEEHKDSTDTARLQQQSGEFLHYVEALNDLYSTGTPPDGDVTARAILPSWLPHSSAITLRVSGGQGYAYAPFVPGLYAQILADTEDSTHFGRADSAGINTPAGRLSRPDFIPPGDVVYVR